MFHIETFNIILPVMNTAGNLVVLVVVVIVVVIDNHLAFSYEQPD